MEAIPNKIQNKLGIVADVNLLLESGLESNGMRQPYLIFQLQIWTKEDLNISNEESLEKLDLTVDGKLKRAETLLGAHTSKPYNPDIAQGEIKNAKTRLEYMIPERLSPEGSEKEREQT